MTVLAPRFGRQCGGSATLAARRGKPALNLPPATTGLLALREFLIFAVFVARVVGRSVHGVVCANGPFTP